MLPPLTAPHSSCVLNFSKPLISSHRNKVFNFCRLLPSFTCVADPTNLISSLPRANSRVHPITFHVNQEQFYSHFLCRHLVELPLCWCLMSEFIWRVSSINGVTQKHFSDFCLASLLALGGAHFSERQRIVHSSIGLLAHIVHWLKNFLELSAQPLSFVHPSTMTMKVSLSSYSKSKMF